MIYQSKIYKDHLKVVEDLDKLVIEIDIEEDVNAI